MAQVEPKVVGDFLLAEGAANLSRKVFTVPTGQNLKLGQVCRTDSSGRKVSLAGTGNEAHTYNPDAAPTAGTFVLHLRHRNGYMVRTANIAYDATNTQIAAAINAVLAYTAEAGDEAHTNPVSVSGTAATAIVITFSGTGYAALSQELGWMDFSALTGVASCAVTRSTSAGAAQNEVQRVAFGAAATGGTVKIGVKIPTAGLDPDQWPLVWTDTAAWSGTDATFLSNINTALDNVLGASKVVATAIAATDTDLGFELTFSGTGFAGIKHPFVQIDAAALTSVSTVATTRVTAGGLAGDRYGNLADPIALENVDATAADKEAVFLVRSAVVNRTRLNFGSADRDTCVAALERVDIVCRVEPSTRQTGP